ncbi:unnamed protein product [Prunus armeniaca]|uniref:Ionotropic glutamate receptor C-terminal domain-containing protein n=1 Tax=Prunus armeniaca TaxID=36596 RepID=A0A6J5W9S1_PRUAR|nr:unnamed protein product [Prunus armeniaca]
MAPALSLTTICAIKYILGLYNAIHRSWSSKVVPVIDNRSKNAWAFLEPWTWDLWLTTSCFFIFIGFCGCASLHTCQTVIGLLSRERVGSNLARFVMSIWIFVVLILTINYTASLASLYTVQQFQPSVTDIKDLIKGFRTTWEIDEALSKGSGKGGVAVLIKPPILF